MTSRLSAKTVHTANTAHAPQRPSLAERCLPIVLPFAVALLAGQAWGQAGTGTIRVSTTGSNFTGCGSAATPCATPNNAINQAEPTGDVVKVEEGVYADFTACSGNPAVLCMVSDIGTIVGGFAGGDWDNSDPVANPTILDGQNARRVIRIQDGASAPPDTASLTLTGVTLRNGFVEGAASGTELEITAFGGCVDAVNAPLFFTDVIVTGCHALGGGTSGGDHGGPGAGGGIALRGFADNIQTSVFERVHFEDNLAEGGSRADSGTVRGGYAQGGGIFVFRSILDATDLTFVDNRAEGGDAPSASGMAVSGSLADGQGAGLNVNVDSVVTIQGVVASGNQSLGGDASTSVGTGGGAFGAALYSELGSLTVTDFDLRGNLSLGGTADVGGLGAGGAFMCTGSDIALDRGVMVDNRAAGGPGSSTAGAAGGGAAYLTSSDGFDLDNLIVADNVAEIGATGSSVGGGGGGFFLQASDGSMDHLTFAANSLSSSLLGEAMVLLTGTDATLDYSIVSDHSGTGTGKAVHVQSGASLTLDTGIFSSNSQDTNDGDAGSGTFFGLGTMSTVADLLYVSPGTPDFDYHLDTSSPAIDAATGSTQALDVDGESRTDPDTGADEFSGPLAEIFSDGFESGNTSAWSVTVE